MQLFGNKLWNDVTDNQHKAYFVMQEDVFRTVTERLDAEGLNHYVFEQKGTYKMAVNDHDLRYFRDVIGDRLLLQMDRTTTTRSNTPQTVIGPTEYRSIQNKWYFTSDIDMVLKIAEHLQQQNVPFSGRVYDDHATITVSAEHEAAVLDINNRVLTERQQHRHTVSQHMIVGSVPYQDIQQPFHFASRMKPQEFMQVRPILDAAEIPYSGIVKNGGIILTVNKQDAQKFGILLNAAQTKQQSISELQEAGFSDHQIALMDPALDRFAEANDYESITSFADPRFSDEQILYIADAAARYIMQSEADRLFDRSGILLDMIHYRDTALRQIEFDEAFRDTAYSPEQRQALIALCDTGITPETLRDSLDESYSVEEMQRIGACFHDSDVDGLLCFMLCEQREPAETPWNVQRWTRNSTDEDFRYTGFDKFAATEQEALDFITRQFERYEDINCVGEITDAVNRNYNDNHFDSEKALREVQEHYPIERIALLLAAEVQNADWDGRYSGSVRDWSRKEMKQHGAAETEIALQRRQFPHPCLTNMLAEAVMEYQAQQAIEEPEIAAEPQQTVQEPAAEKPVKIRNTMEHRIFKKMQALYPEVVQDSPTAHNYEHYESPTPGTGYEPFAIQRLTDWNNGQCLVSMMHTYEQNGDLMRDPDIVLRVDLTQQTATAISYQQDGLGIYREYPDGSYGQRDTNRFMLTWLKNLRDQEREITHAEVEYTHEGTQYSIDLNYEGGELREVLCDGHPEVERAFAKKIGRQLDEMEAAAENEAPADRAVRLINEYCQAEFGQDADYSDMSHVDLAFVSDKDSGLPVEVYADLESYQIIRTLCGTVISEQQYDSLDDMCENALEYLDFNSLTDIDDSERAKAQQPKKPVFSGEFRVGDLFRYERREAEVTQLSGLNPGEVTIAIHDKSTKLAYSVIQNISRDTLIREGEYLGNRLELSPAAQFLMNAENMPSFIDRMYARDEIDTIISRILDNGENAAAVAQETIKPYSHYMSDQETFELTEFGIQKNADDVTFTAEPDSEHPFSVTYSWEQVGDFLRQAAQLQRDVNREAEQAWEREVAESIGEPAVEAAELDPEALAARAEEIERTIQTLQRRIENYNPEFHTPERLQEWKDTLEYLQSDTPENIEITSEALQAFLEKRNQQSRTEMQFTGTQDGFDAVMRTAGTAAFTDVGTVPAFDGETLVNATLTENTTLSDVQNLIRIAAENGCYLTPGAAGQLKERFGDDFMPELPLNGTFRVPQSDRQIDITAVGSFTMSNTYGEYEGGIDSSGHERMDNFSSRTESINFAYQGGGIVESQHYSGSEFQQYPDIEVYNIYDPVQRERMIADIQEFADKSDYLVTDIQPACGNYINHMEKRMRWNDTKTWNGLVLEYGKKQDSLLVKKPQAFSIKMVNGYQWQFIAQLMLSCSMKMESASHQ